MRLPDFLRSTSFRWALGVAGAFGICTLLLFGFVYWETADYVIAAVDTIVTSDAQSMNAAAPDQLPNTIRSYLEDDPRRVKLAGLFGPDGAPVTGNIEAMPLGLPIDDLPHAVRVGRVETRGHELQGARALARRLPSGEILVVGHDTGLLRQVGQVVARALSLGLLPALCLAIVTGIWFSKRAQRRIDEMNHQVQRVVAGHLKERLPTGGYDDPVNRLAKIVNSMLDDIERLVGELASVGDDIAHDLRTPLTRVRAILERGRDSAQTLQDLSAATDRAIAGLDQSLSIITALLRIAEIDQSRRLAGMGPVRLAEILQVVHELYQPIAEDKGVSLQLELNEAAVVPGDYDLLLEAIANLVDNAVKFTPAQGSVDLRLLQRPEGPVVRVEDTGPGIRKSERDAVLTRFYRSDRSRHAAGVGLGLSLVAAIVKLHGFRLAIMDGPGCRIEIACHAA